MILTELEREKTCWSNDQDRTKQDKTIVSNRSCSLANSLRPLAYLKMEPNTRIELMLKTFAKRCHAKFWNKSINPRDKDKVQLYSLQQKELNTHANANANYRK